jgi:hypothetical protein
MAKKVKRKIFNNDEKYMFVVGEVQKVGRRYVKLLDDKKWEWTLFTRNATKFSSIQEAEDAIEVAFEEDDFDLNIYAVVKNSKEYVLYSTSSLNDNFRKIVDVDSTNILEEDVEKILWNEEEIDFDKMSSNFIIKNQKELRSLIIIKIGQLIDFHNRCNNYFTTTQSSKDEKLCECKICQKIKYFVNFLDRPEMSKKALYAKEIKKDFKKFLSLNRRGFQKRTDEQLAILASCFKNYKLWRNFEFTKEEIAQCIGIGKNTYLAWEKELKENGYGYLFDEERI